MTTKTDEVLDLLVQGREYFRAHDWYRGGAFFEHFPDPALAELGGCCGVGAVIAAAGATGPASFRVKSGGVGVVDIYGRLSAALPDPGSSFYDYNDHFAKSKDDILAVFDRAIEARRQELAG